MKEFRHEYFPHDYNASGDENIIKLLRTFGNQGYGIFWRIVEKLYQAEGLILADFELLAYDLRDDAKKIKRIIEDFDLFYRKGKQFGSYSVDRRLGERLEKSEKARRAGLASAKAKSTSVEREPNDSPTIKKGKKERIERKIEKTGGPRFAEPTIEEVLAYCRERGNGVDPNRFHAYYTSNGWKVGKNPMKDWRAAVRTWERDGAEPKSLIQKIVKTCESERCCMLLLRPQGMKFPKDCEKCEAAVGAK